MKLEPLFFICHVNMFHDEIYNHSSSRIQVFHSVGEKEGLSLHTLAWLLFFPFFSGEKVGGLRMGWNGIYSLQAASFYFSLLVRQVFKLLFMSPFLLSSYISEILCVSFLLVVLTD